MALAGKIDRYRTKQPSRVQAFAFNAYCSGFCCTAQPIGGVKRAVEVVCICFTMGLAFRGDSKPFGSRALRIAFSKRMRKTGFNTPDNIGAS